MDMVLVACDVIDFTAGLPESAKKKGRVSGLFS
jgi:hypothetical protein